MDLVEPERLPFRDRRVYSNDMWSIDKLILVAKEPVVFCELEWGGLANADVVDEAFPGGVQDT